MIRMETPSVSLGFDSLQAEGDAAETHFAIGAQACHVELRLQGEDVEIKVRVRVALAWLSNSAPTKLAE